MLFTSAVAFAFAALANAASQTVMVGPSGQLMFSPNTITASAGDTINFQWAGGSIPHSVVQSTFASPCSNSGFNSGSMSSGSFTLTVNDTNPIWVYCATPGHCTSGMVMAINAPSSGNTFAAFQAAAEGKPLASSSGGSSATSATSGAASATSSAAAATSSTGGSSNPYGGAGRSVGTSVVAAGLVAAGVAAAALL